MKRLVEISEGTMESLLGENIQVWCLNYIYSGELVGVNKEDIVLRNAHVVYETGPLTDKQFKNAQPLPVEEWYIKTAVIESYGLAPQL
jgi:hypothetical protein